MIAFPCRALVTTVLSLSISACSREPVFSPERVRAHVGYLADDLLEGRKTGSRGHEIAARYVAAQFEACGLKPAGEDGWYQRVMFQRTRYVPDAASATIRGPGGELRLAHGKQAMVYLNPQKLRYSIEAPLVFVGYGMESDRFGLHDYDGLDVKGKIVVLLSGFPKGMPSEEGAHLNSTKTETAQHKGAIGVISVRTLQSEQTFPWSRMQEHAFDPDFNWVGKDGQPFVRAPGITGGASLSPEVAGTLFVGASRTFQDILAEADRTGGSPRGFALRTSALIEAEGAAERLSSPNVIGVLPGTDQALAAQHVVLSAHLDHLGISEGTDGDADRINNGALDNAAGVATMLEVACAAAAAKKKPRRSILFLATTAEEEGLLGADYYARHPTVPIRQIVGNVDLDMPVLLYPFNDVIAFGADHSSLGPQVAKAAATMGIVLSPDPAPQEGVFTRSDHYMFVQQGVPAVFLATGYGNGGEKHWDSFRAGPYHHPNDDMNQAIDWQAGARFAEVNYRITREMADADVPPSWNKGDFFAETFAPAR
jgi:Zn-dependent M28 family amino/carboxypeptidase